MHLNSGPLTSLSDSDQALFSLFGCGETRQVPFSCVHHAFEFHAERQPNAVAVEHHSQSITYSELEHHSNALAHSLRKVGVLPGTRVCLLVQRCIPMVIGILAILKAGGQYVPLDGGIVTQSTLEFVIEDSDASVLLVLQEFGHRVQNFATRQTLILEEAISLACRDSQNLPKPRDVSSADDGIYVIYTSGTTGKPKGVSVKHRNVTNLVCLSPGNVGMSPGMRVAQLLNVAFDMCAWEVLGSLCNGCTLCIRGKSSKEWRELMKTVDIIVATPSILASHDASNYSNVKYVATAGEVCSQSLADNWGKSAQFFNCCGPTEITIVNTVHHHVSGSPVSIGRPTPNNTVYILDENMVPQPIGQPGVMWAGGAGISEGYINLPEKTNERYKLDPFMNDGSFMFNTGDLGRWNSDGQLEHLGRIDDQIKIKGFRVELDGVALAMETCEDVKASTALLVDGELCGFVAPQEVDIDAVRIATMKIQPYYAVPTRFYRLAEIPLTSNGKIDKRALLDIAKAGQESKESIILKPSQKTNMADSSTEAHAQAHELSVYDIIWPQGSTLPITPPPVYQKDAHASEMAFVDMESNASSNYVNSNEKVNTTDVEKGHVLDWDGYKSEVLPNKIQGRFLRNLRHQIFTLYRRLFSVVFLVNVAILVATTVRGTYDARSLGVIVVANLFCAVLMRQDYIINAFFNVFCSIPASWPLSIRRVAARVYHIGGLHSGCAISGVVWLIAFTVRATYELMHGEKCSGTTVAITYFILSLLLCIVIFAYPKFRLVAHDRFERTHRFLGWTTVLLVWFQIVFLTRDYRNDGESLGQALMKSPPFWLVVTLTFSIILPWIRLRKVPVRAEVLSSHAVRLHFDYVTPVPGTFARISDNPLFEWHGFATVPEPGKKGYSLVVSRAGDWTSKQIDTPPSSLWVRGIPTCGVLRIVPLFRRLVFVVTGSGIGPCAPCILEQRVPIRLLWTSPNVRKTFGDRLVDSILDASPGAVVYDTRSHGKPDMVKLTYRLVREFQAEAVCVISNQKLTRKIVYGIMSRGIPAFGAIWDS